MGVNVVTVEQWVEIFCYVSHSNYFHKGFGVRGGGIEGIDRVIKKMKFLKHRRGLKGTVSVIANHPACKDDNAWVTTVP